MKGRNLLYFWCIIKKDDVKEKPHDPELAFKFAFKVFTQCYVCAKFEDPITSKNAL